MLSGLLNRGLREVCLEDKSFLNTVNTGTLRAFDQMFLDGKECRLQSSIARYDNPCIAYFFYKEKQNKEKYDILKSRRVGHAKC